MRGDLILMGDFPRLWIIIKISVGFPHILNILDVE